MGYYQLLGDYRLADRHREAIKQVTAEKVMDVARRYFHPDNLSVVSYAPGKGSVTETEADALAMVQEVLSADGGITDMSGSPDPSTLAGVEDTVGDRVDVENREDGSVERFDLANGVRVVVKRRTTVPTVSMVSVFQGGGRFEPKGKSGIAMLTHRSLIKGSASYNADEIVQQVEGLGGSIDSYASFDTGGTAMGILSEFLDEALPIYKDVVRNPKFAPDRVEQERTRLLEELAQRHDNPIHLTMDELFGRVFGDHPYAYPFLGKQDEVQQLTAEDCAAWYRSLLVPANVVVSFVGDIDRDHAEKIANELYGDLKAGPVRTPEFTVAENPMQSGEFIIERPDLKQGVTFVGFLAPRMMTDDSLALQVLNGALTGLGGRLFVELRDKRSLGYMTGSALNPLFERSIFFGYANPGADGLSEAVRVIFHELDLVARAEVTDEEFTRSKEWLLGSQVMQLQKNGAQASAYGTYEALGFGWEVVDKAPERIQRVTKAEMMRVAEEVFKPEHAVVVKMVPGS